MKEVTKNVKFDLNTIKYHYSKPVAVMHVDPAKITHLEIFTDYCRLTSGNWTGPSFNKDQVFDILATMTKVKDEPIDRFSFGREAVKFRGNGKQDKDVWVSRDRCIFGKVIVNGEGPCRTLFNALTSFYHGDYKNQMETVTLEHDSVYTSIVGKDGFGDGDKFAWWEFKRNRLTEQDDPRIIHYHQLEITGVFEIFRLDFTDTSVISELIKGVKEIMECKKEYKLNVSELGDINARLFRFNISDDLYAVGISTDCLRYAQRSFIFFGENSGKKFLNYLEEVKELFEVK